MREEDSLVSLIEEAYGESQGWAEIVIASYESGTFVVEQEKWFRWPDQAEDLYALVAHNSHKDVYFCTSLMSEKKRGKEYATVTNFVYVDADDCHPDNFRVMPTLSVETSPGSYQCYWALAEPIPAHQAAELAHRICVRHDDDGCDPSGWIPAKLMRVPGTTHGKDHDNKHTVEIVEVTGQIYTPEDILEHYGDVELPPQVDYAERPMPAKFPMVIDVASRLSAFPELEDLYMHEPNEGEDWSRLRWRLALDMFREGFVAAEVFVAIKNTRYNKYAVKKRPDSHLWAEILKAEATAQNEVIGAAAAAQERREEAQNFKSVFLSPEERESVEPCFIDTYTDWVGTRSPLAAKKYSRMLGFVLLSCVYGGWGYIEPQFGPMKLNLWALLLGESTATRKSTARNLFLTVLRQWEKDLPEDRRVELGSDFTPEGLNAALAERDGQVSLTHRDEISGFFNEMFTKNYLAGAVERMTDLYEGHVMMTMRASKGASQQKRAETIFNFLGIGIEKETAAVLTAKNFQSGFLPRMLWCVADPPQWEPEHEYLTQGSRGKASDDPKVTEFINMFRRARSKWGRKPEGHLIRFDDDAWDRWNQWRVESKEAIRGMDIEALAEPSRDRMSFSIAKAAALLAMHEGSDTVKMKHLLYVLREAEVWFDDMLRMARGVGQSDWEGQVNEVEAYIANSKSGIDRWKVYRKFGHRRKGEVDEMVGALLSQGRIKMDQGQYKINS